MAAGITYDSIASTTLSSASSTISFNSISGSFSDLRLVFIGQLTTGTATVRIRLNNDSGSLYSSIRLSGNGTSVSSATNATTNQIIINTSLSTEWSTSLIDIFNYAGSTFKTVVAQSSENLNTTGSRTAAMGMWRNTAAVTSIELSTSASTFIIGSTASLYGITRA